MGQMNFILNKCKEGPLKLSTQDHYKADFGVWNHDCISAQIIERKSSVSSGVASDESESVSAESGHLDNFRQCHS